MACSIVTVDRQLTAVVKATVPFPGDSQAPRKLLGSPMGNPAGCQGSPFRGFIRGMSVYVVLTRDGY